MQSGFHSNTHINNLYAALLGETTWETFLAKLVADIPGQKASLFFYDEAANSGALAVNTGLEPSQIKSFRTYYSGINPLMRNATKRPVHKGTVAQEMSPPEILHKSEFYNDYLLPMQIRSAAGVTIMQEPRRHFFLTAFIEQFDFDRNKVFADRLGAVSPHLRRAFDLYRRNSRPTTLQSAVTPILEAYGVAAIVLGEGAVPKHISDSAKSIMEDGRLMRASGSRLMLQHADGDALMRSMATRFYRGRKSASFLCDRHRITLVSIETDAATLYFEGPSVLVLIEPLLRNATEASLEALRLAFGISRGEARVMTGLVDGLTVNEIAALHGVSSETVKTQTKSVYAKCGVTGKADLMRMLNLSALRDGLDGA